MNIEQLIISFCQTVYDESGCDITLARAKTMVALVSLTWPNLGIEVTPYCSSRGRIVWRSEELDGLSLGGGFRRDPVGDNAPIIIDNIATDQLIMVKEMRECAELIPLFGRQRLERLDHVLAELFSWRTQGTPLPAVCSRMGDKLFCEEEYGLLREWLIKHDVVSTDGEWIDHGVKF